MTMLKLLLAFTFVFNFNLAMADDRADALRLWQKRDDQASLEQALAKFETLHKANPTDIETLLYLTRGYFTLAELHFTDKDKKMDTFEKARKFGVMGLETNPEYKKLAKNDVEEAISKLTQREAPITFWTATSLGKWAKLNGVMSSLGKKGEILAMVKQVDKTMPDYFHGGVPRYWGGFYAIAPGIAGGDMDKSKDNFKKAMKVAPEYLGTKTLYAEAYLVKKDDKKGFKQTLEEVIAAPVGPEEIAPENKLEKKKAQRLLKEMDDLF
jgi:tetratricopeptide (TPR) repeat protein